MKERTVCSPDASTPELKRGAKIKVRAADAPPPHLCEEERTLSRAEWPAPIWRVSAHRACQHNEERAARFRVLKQTHDTDLDTMLSLRDYARSLARTLPMVEVTPELEEVVRTLPDHRRKLYREALQMFLEEGLTTRDVRISAFVKMEKQQILKDDKDPRMIQARGVKFNLLLAQFTKSVEKHLYQLKDPEFAKRGLQIPLVAKGMNLDQRARALRILWEQTDEPLALSLDLSRWDQHVSSRLLEVMHEWYLTLMPNRELRYLLQFQFDNKCATSHGVVYTAPDGVMSGDMTTALGNCVAVIVINLKLREELQKAAAEIERDISQDNKSSLQASLEGVSAPQTEKESVQEQLRSVIRELANEMSTEQRSNLFRTMREKIWFKLLDDGDDHVIIVEKVAAAVLEKALPIWWHAVGHKMRVDGTTDQFHQIQFCQHKPHLLGDSWTMMPDPRKVLATSTVVTGVYQDKPKEYLATVWAARAELHQGMPILGPLFKRWSKFAGNNKLSEAARRRLLAGIDRLLTSNRDRVPRSDTVTAESRAMAWEQWDLTPEEQAQLEMISPSFPSPNDPLIITSKWNEKLHQVEV